MALPDPQKVVSDLSVTNYGEIAFAIPAKIGINTMDLSITNYGEIFCGNDFIVSSGGGTVSNGAFFQFFDI